MISVFDTMALALLCLRPVSVSNRPDTLGMLAAPVCSRPVANRAVDTLAASHDDGSDALPWSLRLASSPVPVTFNMPSLHDDSLPRRGKAIVHSDAYYSRLELHRKLSFAMLPLFAFSYISGDQLMKYGPDAPAWARKLHGPSATAVTILFGANAITGGWNLWEGRQDPEGRTRKILHTVLFIAASGGFSYAGSVLANEAETSAVKRSQHKTVTLVSMGVSTVSWLIMLIPHQ